MQEFFSELKNDKIEFNWNKNPIKMKTFLGFLTVPVTKASDNFGADNGWTLHFNKDAELKIGGGIIGGIEWLNSIEYKKNLQNPYNNLVNPFFLGSLLTEEGRLFFASYYKEDITKLIAEQSKKVSRAALSLEAEKAKYSTFTSEAERLGIYINQNEVKS